MVKTHQEQPHPVAESADIDLWLRQVGELRPALDLTGFRDACELSRQAEERAIAANSIWEEGHSSFKTGLAMAEILNQLSVDESGMLAAIIYRAVRENQLTVNHVRKQFGDEVTRLVEGTLKMAAISDIQFGTNKTILGERKDQLEQARRLLVSLADDVRVVLLKLAERTCAIRTAIRNNSPKGVKLAHEVFEIYAPLAHRLGIGHLKWELEDGAFRLLESVAYKQIAHLLDEKRSARQDYIAAVVQELEQRFRLLDMDALVNGRAKHIYSIWRKMQRKHIPFSEVYDVRAIRIQVASNDDCYRVLGVVHSLWRVIPNEFDDYIANPKENGYQSLHTAVLGPEGKVLEIQIRTGEMHKDAELGVCAHWTYKDSGDGGDKDNQIDTQPDARHYEHRLEWLRHLLDTGDELHGAPAVDLMGEDSGDRIYVFTPEGDVVEMAFGATPIDFAYKVHTEIGHKCRGAKVNGRVLPLNTRLASGDRVEIIVGDEPEPRREWLHDHLGYVSSARARAKIQAWFSKRKRAKNIDDGRKILLAELDHLGVEHLELSALVEKTGYDSAESLFYALAIGQLDVVALIEQAAELVNLDVGWEFIDPQSDGDDAPAGPLISGQGDLDYAMSACCHPVPGDSIVGVIDDNDLVNVHRQDCLQALRTDVYSRQMKLSWRHGPKVTFPVGIEVLAWDRAGLIHDISSVLMLDNTNVQEINTISDMGSSRIILKLTIEVPQLNKLLQILEKIEQLPNVTSARRTILTS